MYFYIVLLLLVMLLSLLSTKKRSDFNDSFLSKDQTKNIQGFTALFILLHHLSQNTDLPRLFVVMDYIGFICVAMFFFISGYGLMYNYKNKEDYLSGFLVKRLSKVLVPYEIINIIAIIGFSIQNVYFSPSQYVLSFFGFDTITGTWYVTAILLFYIFFYVSFVAESKLNKKNLGIVLMTLFTIIYIIVCLILNVNSSWTASIFAFLFGIAWHEFGNKFVLFIRNKYWIKLVTVTVLFLFSFVGRLSLSYFGVTNDLLQMILRNIVSIIFVLLVITILQKFECIGFVIEKISKISYELYICHYVMIALLSKAIENDYLFILITILSSFALSYVLSSISKKVLNY